MEWITFTLFGLGIACYSISQLAVHKKLKWMKPGFGFLGEDSYLRKYKNIHKDKTKFQVMLPLRNWYYRLFKIKYHEAFPLSSTFLVFTTDLYHFSQHLSFIFFSLSLSLATDINFLWIWPAILLTNFTAYRLLSK